jgi:hypothetical protein
MHKLALGWVLGGVLCCVLLVDLLLLNYNQKQCSVCVQLNTASLSLDDHHDVPGIAGGFRLVRAHGNKKSTNNYCIATFNTV